MINSPQVSPVLESFPLDVKPLSSVERILYYLALGTMKAGGHRYGAFLDASTTAAKLALYCTYKNLGDNVRRTSLLYHVEPKRVRAIVKEVTAVLEAGLSLRSIPSTESYYLITLPPLWQQTFPCGPSESRLSSYNLTPGERRNLEQSLPPHSPRAKILDVFDFDDLIQTLHTASQQKLPPEQQMPFSEALLQHIKFQLLHSETVMRLDAPMLDLPLFALLRPSYSPKGEQARVMTMIDDVSHYFELLLAWSRGETSVLRAIEAFDIDPAQQAVALQELDDLLRTWADKYHHSGGKPMVLYAAAGQRNTPPASAEGDGAPSGYPSPSG